MIKSNHSSSSYYCIGCSCKTQEKTSDLTTIKNLPVMNKLMITIKNINMDSFP